MEESNYTPSLRILMTTDTVGGVWSYSVELCKSMLPFDIHFYLVTFGARLQPSQVLDIETLSNVTVYETDFLLEWMPDPWKNIEESGKWLLKLEEELEPDVIHINGFSYGSLPWKAPVIIVAHSDVYSWWLSVKGDFPPNEWQTYFNKIRSGLQGADYLIAPSKWMMDQVKQIYAVELPGRVIYNGRRQEDFYPSRKTQAIFSMGRLWDEAKNVNLLTEAAPGICRPVKLAGTSNFAGDNYNPASKNIVYLGKLPPREVAEQLSVTAIYVLPAKYEPFGLSVLEAALSGCALVLGNIDSLKEIWEDNVVFVDTADVEALSHTVNTLIGDADMLQHYAAAARKHAARYNTTIMGEAYLRVYYQLKQKVYATPVNY